MTPSSIARRPTTSPRLLEIDDGALSVSTIRAVRADLVRAMRLALMKRNMELGGALNLAIMDIDRGLARRQGTRPRYVLR
jgi:hypothetical protein